MARVYYRPDIGLMSVGLLIVVSVTIVLFFLRGGFVSAMHNPQPGVPVAAFRLSPHYLDLD